MTANAKKTTRRNVGEIILRGRIWYVRYYDGGGRRRGECTQGDGECGGEQADERRPT